MMLIRSREISELCCTVHVKRHVALTGGFTVAWLASECQTAIAPLDFATFSVPAEGISPKGITLYSTIARHHKDLSSLRLH